MSYNSGINFGASGGKHYEWIVLLHKSGSILYFTRTDLVMLKNTFNSILI